MPESDKAQPSLDSKSQIKKQMEDLQKIGQALIALSSTELAQIPLPTELQEAIDFAHTLKTREVKRRHLQYVGKLMRYVDDIPILKALKMVQIQKDSNSKVSSKLLTYRDKTKNKLL